MRSMVAGIQGLVFFVVMIATFAGCGGKKQVVVADPDALPSVQCKVKLGGKEIGGLAITLHSEEGSAKQIVSRYDSESESYQFITTDQGKQRGGVPIGKYTATVAAGPIGKVKIPSKYADPKKSGLTVEIVKGDNNLPPFELTP